MPRGKQSSSALKVREMDLREAKREFSRRSARGSKYDKVLDAAEQLQEGKALLVDQISYSEVTGIRTRMKEYLSGDFKVEATKVDKDKNLYDVLIQRL